MIKDIIKDETIIAVYKGLPELKHEEFLYELGFKVETEVIMKKIMPLIRVTGRGSESIIFALNDKLLETLQIKREDLYEVEEELLSNIILDTFKGLKVVPCSSDDIENILERSDLSISNSYNDIVSTIKDYCVNPDSKVFGLEKGFYNALEYIKDKAASSVSIIIEKYSLERVCEELGLKVTDYILLEENKRNYMIAEEVFGFYKADVKNLKSIEKYFGRERFEFLVLGTLQTR